MDPHRMTIHALVTMANYGKAPGFIEYIEVGSGSLDKGLPEQPAYSKRFDILDLYFPDMKMEDVRSTRAVVEIPGDGRHVVFQRVWYTDSVGKRHFSGSIYRLYVSKIDKQLHVFDEPVLPGSAYWDWDKSESDRP